MVQDKANGTIRDLRISPVKSATLSLSYYTATLFSTLYYYLYNNVLFVTLNTGAYPGGNDNENAGNVNVPSASKDNSEAEAIVSNFRTTLNAATAEYSGQYQWLVVTHHKSTQTVAKHAADSDIENYVDAGFEQVMDNLTLTLY